MFEQLPGQDELPYDDGEPLESARHREQMNLLIDSLRRHLHPRTDVYVGGNMAVYYSPLQARAQDFLVPDFFAAADGQPERERKSWVIWEELGHGPFVVIELLSPSTEDIDRGRKMQVYAGIGVQEYYLFDPEDLRLEGFRLRPAGPPVPLAPVDGLLPCESLGLGLAVRNGVFLGRTSDWLRWCTPDGRMAPTWEEAEREPAEAERERAESAQARAEAERERAESAQARAERLAARLRAAGIDPGEL